jgi:hypothetical protein
MRRHWLPADGEWWPSASTEAVTVRDPATGEPVGACRG